MANAKRHHVIVGGSAAGVSAALSMRRAGFEGQITLVEADTAVPYQRPPLSKSFEDLDSPKVIVPEVTYDDHDVQLLSGERVASLDEDRRRVVLESGTDLQADSVLVATGVLPRRLGVPGDDLNNVLTLRDINDARALASRLDAGPLVVVGGGFIGLEVAAAARLRGQHVTVIEALRVPLTGALGDEVGSLVTNMHLARGVHVVTERTVVELRGDGDVESVILNDGSQLNAATVVVGCGVSPNDELARRAGVFTDNGIVIDEYGQTSRGWIWAAGDVATFESPFTDRRQRIEHWNVAQGQGAVVGANMAGTATAYRDVPYFWSDQYDSHLQMYGRAVASDRLTIRPSSEHEGFLALWIRDDVLVAAASIGESKQLRLAKNLIEHHVPVRETELANPHQSLRELVKQHKPQAFR
ncbi:FAD-dependent oxidoreductase [Rhodococcus erythropolis]|uniref:Ferredoxin reductase n=2 Tax=Rhodococcus erythropolis TaxID=1833 RepID=O69367_RHOER|nr:ferredoxin reductase [Rhodococcus erythropolis]